MSKRGSLRVALLVRARSPTAIKAFSANDLYRMHLPRCALTKSRRKNQKRSHGVVAASAPATARRRRSSRRFSKIQFLLPSVSVFAGFRSMRRCCLIRDCIASSSPMTL